MEPAAETMPPEQPSTSRPSLIALFVCFTAVGMQSFGGGLSGWIRLKVVQRRGWITDSQFLSGLALSQVAPGSNAVNLSVFIGTTLRGTVGGIVAALGLLLLPLGLLILIGAFYLGVDRSPVVEILLAGMGAAAIGFNLATGIRLMRRNIRNLEAAGIMVATALAVGVFRLPLLPVLAVMTPLSLLCVWLRQRRPA